mmetsp:Transcript_12092/g.18971  ORF Transcript_12092/g.18971 Transcript_12092/m.18971 type:complete len:330 (+) Transcript_12092:425-1414(+)|eukprot:CAMPEP_0184289360 /NCGR_PEP_ID=MMETSP1049-20130417/1818_1 /TAXON_ID=77928 /ORGANISM="Proteomonas sulcata, Strain CCMP704" /LENGTH=329 /DNA_ID=CAMNT_0026596135 /DNA_START=567 /DNA_END=1556 /DNA_ORIENTATION=+
MVQPMKPMPVLVKTGSPDTTGHNPMGVFSKLHNGHWEIQPNEFLLHKEIGQGAMGIIFRGSLRGITCAAKKLKDRCNKAENVQAYKDLIMELDILVSIGRHPNLVEFYGACIVDQSSPVIFEEFVDGPSLETYLTNRRDRGAPKPTRSAVYTWCMDMLRALDFLHNRDPIIIHRDMKPGNLLLTRDFTVLKLADFGMGKFVNKADMPTAKHTGHTGTVRYMAPEVYGTARAHYTEKVDIYSAAMIMWYISTQLRPVVQDKNKDIESRPDLSKIEWPEMRELMAKMWVKEPQNRPNAFQCVAELGNMPGRPNPLMAGDMTQPAGCGCSIM